MRRSLQVGTRLIIAGCAMLAVGCKCEEDLKLCREENDRLVGEMDGLRAELAQAQDQVDQAKASSAGYQTRISELQDALSKAGTGGAKEGEFTVLGPGLAWLSLPGSVLFDSGKAKLKDSPKTRLNTIAGQISSQYGGRDVFVIGHTDTDRIKVSGWDDNYELSCQRALSVARYLIKQGVPASRVVAAGCGEHRPVADNRSAAGKSRNRRVEVFAVSRSFGGGD
ncbi:MAG TPA: OmpA family protein [Phycisphaerae bacterium]|nr:OmpA family protein [Phycisphaerae bacterium]